MRHHPPHVPLQRLLPAPECHEFQVAGAGAAGDLLEVVEGVGEENHVSLQEGRAVLPTQLGEVLELLGAERGLLLTVKMLYSGRQ